MNKAPRGQAEADGRYGSFHTGSRVADSRNKEPLLLRAQSAILHEHRPSSVDMWLE